MHTERKNVICSTNFADFKIKIKFSRTWKLNLHSRKHKINSLKKSQRKITDFEKNYPRYHATKRDLGKANLASYERLYHKDNITDGSMCTDY